jgi:hypothetical protein
MPKVRTVEFHYSVRHSPRMILVSSFLDSLQVREISVSRSANTRLYSKDGFSFGFKAW